MDIRFLVTFMEVAQTRHFGKAAENLYLTQSAVSARIKQLEEYFNSALFVRNRNSLQLTPAGEKLLPYAATLADTLEQARQALNEQSIQFLTVACTPNAWHLYLKSNLDTLNKQLDDVSLRAEMVSHEQLSRMVHEHSIDLAISTVPFKSDDVESLKISESALSLYAPLQHEPNRLQQIAIDWGSKTNEALDKIFPELKKASFRSGSIEVALNFLATSNSQIVLPNSIANPLVEHGKLVHLSDIAELSVSCYLIYLKETKDAWLGEMINGFKQHQTNKQGQ